MCLICGHLFMEFYGSRIALQRDAALGIETLNRARIVLADDNSTFLKEISSVLKGKFDVVGTAKDGKSALDLIRDCGPDLVVLDIGMPDLNGIDICLRLAKTSGGPRIVFCSVESDPEIVKASRQAGGLGYVFKSRIATDLVCAINLALEGKSFVSRDDPQKSLAYTSDFWSGSNRDPAV